MEFRKEEERAEWLKNTLMERGVGGANGYGMMSAVQKKMGVSMGIVQSWFKGKVNNTELAVKLAVEYDFVLTDWICKDLDPKTTFGPRRLAEMAKVQKITREAEDKGITEKALLTTLEFIATRYKPEGQECDPQWRQDVVKAFFAIKELLKAGVEPNQLMHFMQTAEAVGGRE